jgi:penicillin-binding protein 1A
VKLADVKSLSDISPWRMAVVLETSDQSARIGFQPGRELGGAISKQRQTGIITLDGVRWAKPTSGPARGRTPNAVSQILSPGDVIYADPLIRDGTPIEGQFRLRQLPEVSGAMVVMDPWTGRVLAMVGGFSFDQSQFNRATQAYRQPGSSFKPIVYSSALDNGYTPSTVVVDAPIEIDQGQGGGVWRPENYSSGKYNGPTTLRNALRLSLNTVTVRLAQDIGMPLIGEYARRFGVYDELPNYLSYALGAGETTVMRMVTAYSMFANGGRRVKATLIDRIQDRYGHTIFKHDSRECRGCDAPNGWKNQPEPQLVDRREQVLDTMTAYQITSMMEGVVQGGTAIVVKEVGKPIAGKTGTTNEAKDAWFIGFSPDIVVGIYLGYDKPRTLGHKATGGALAAPIARDFLKLALADKPAIPFKAPVGIKLIWVDAKSGMRAVRGEGRTILEAFKPGTAPPDNYSVIGVADADGRQMLQPSPDADRSLFRPGTGGLY